MSGKASLPLTVEIAFGAGPLDPDPLTWTDVSAYVRRSQTISLSRDRDPKSGEPSGRGQLRFKNPDGRFTVGATGTYGLVRNRLPIRVKQGATVLWTGLVEKWGQATDAGVRSTVDATLVDRWPRLKQRKFSGDRIQSACQGLGPEDLWPLTDLIGSTRAVSVTSSWVLKPEPGHIVAWGTADNPVSGVAKTAAVGSPDVVLSKMWDGAGATAPGLYGSGFTVSLWSRMPSDAGSVVWDVDNIDADGLKVEISRTLIAVESDTLALSPAALTYTTSGTWRHVVLACETSGATPVLRMWVNGAQVWTYTAPYDPAWTPLREHTLTCVQCDLAYVATWDRALSASEVAIIAASGLNALGQTGDKADVRAALVAAMWQPTTVTTSGTFTATMSKQTIDGVSQADLLLACAQAEDGQIITDVTGWPKLTPRGARSDAALAATIPDSVIAHDVTWELDDQAVVNVAQVDRMALDQVASTVSRRNDASVDTYGEVSDSLQLWLDTDAQAVDRANAMVLMWADAAPRSRAFTVDLMTCAATISPATLLAVDIGSRIQVSGLGAVYPAGTSAGYYVDGITDEITAESWRRTFTVSPAIDYLVLDDSTFGGLDEWPLG